MIAKLGAALATLTFIIHIAVGHFDTLVPLLSADLPLPVLGAFQACWHMISVFLAYSACQFWRGGPIAVHMAFLWIAFAVIFIAVGVWQSGPTGLLVVPQWILLGPAAALVLTGHHLGASRSSGN